MIVLFDTNVIENTDVMVTGDRKLQDIKPMRKIRIVFPRAF
jgi:predicted nucleic acid-binding protein